MGIANESHVYDLFDIDSRVLNIYIRIILKNKKSKLICKNTETKWKADQLAR